MTDKEMNAVGDKLEPSTDRLYELWDEVEELKATTFEGAAAKATLAVMRVLHERASSSGYELDKMDWGEGLAFETCRDLVAIGETAS